MTLKIALSKGRILQESEPLLAKIGIIPTENLATTRKLIIDTQHSDIQLMIVRATDVPTYVEYGAADIGIAGKDVLLEYDCEDLYEPVDLKIAPCRLVLAGKADIPLPTGRLRIATKYVNITERYFAKKATHVDIIKLYGSMELAPLVGLADGIVDLVDTGNTLKANGLIPLDTIINITSHLIVNKGAMKMKHAAVKKIINRFREIV